MIEWKGEFPGEELYVPIFQNGEVLAINDIEDARARAEATREDIRELAKSQRGSLWSPQTMNLTVGLRAQHLN